MQQPVPGARCSLRARRSARLVVGATRETDGCAMPRRVPGSSRGERRRTSLLLPPLRSVPPLARRPYWESPRSVRRGSSPLGPETCVQSSHEVRRIPLALVRRANGRRRPLHEIRGGFPSCPFLYERQDPISRAETVVGLLKGVPHATGGFAQKSSSRRSLLTFAQCGSGLGGLDG